MCGIFQVTPAHSFGSFAIDTDTELELRIKAVVNDSSTYSNPVMISDECTKLTAVTTRIIKVSSYFSHLHNTVTTW